MRSNTQKSEKPSFQEGPVDHPAPATVAPASDPKQAWRDYVQAEIAEGLYDKIPDEHIGPLGPDENCECLNCGNPPHEGECTRRKCPACASRRRHSPEERRHFHPDAGNGFSRDHGKPSEEAR